MDEDQLDLESDADEDFFLEEEDEPCSPPVPCHTKPETTAAEGSSPA
jgi:hypothetical protein